MFILAIVLPYVVHGLILKCTYGCTITRMSFQNVHSCDHITMYM